MAGELVLTPGGYKPAERVHHVRRGHHLHMRGEIAEIHDEAHNVVKQVGAIEKRQGGRPLLPDNISKLEPTRPSAKPADLPGPIPGESAGFAEIDGWVSYTGWTNAGPNAISLFSSRWTVPPEPVNRGSQTIFLFNGIQNSTMIYQPVLQWGPSAAGGGKKWSIACWYADGQTGHSFFSSLVDVDVGNVLTGIMTLTAQNNNLFSYSAQFQGHDDTILPIVNVEQLTWANETLEAYVVASRNDFPAGDRTDITAIRIETGSAPPNLDWTKNNAQPASGSSVQIISNSAADGAVSILYAPATAVG